jgi:uncharacterized protein (TIGR02246 family)
MRGILNNARGDMSVQSEEAVRQVVRAVVEAWNVHDAGAFAAAFEDEADFTNVLGMHASGREAIERFHAATFETRFRESRLTATDTTVRLIRDDVAAVDVHWEMIGARDPHDNELPPRRGILNLVVTRNDDAWAIAVMHNMDLPTNPR